MTVRPVIFHPKARDEIRRFPRDVRNRVGKALFMLQIGEPLSMPHSRPMPDVGAGVAELRIRDEDRAYRVFYHAASAKGILVFHAFVKKPAARHGLKSNSRADVSRSFSMHRIRPAIATTPEELAHALRLSTADAEEWQVQHTLLTHLREIVRRKKMTHAQVAKRAGTSRTRVTAILNDNLNNVSTDLLIRILGSLGYRVRVSVARVGTAA
jgi:phage-related protein/predicted XRE-type DNA-binding protein